MTIHQKPIADKAEYVRSQPQTRQHECHWPGCGKQVPPAMWGCKAHWFKLPPVLRAKIWRAYRPGQERDMRPSDAYLAVAGEVQAWIHEQEARKLRALAAKPAEGAAGGGE